MRDCRRLPIDLVLIGLHTSIYYLAHRKLLRVLLLVLDQCLYSSEPFVKYLLVVFSTRGSDGGTTLPHRAALTAVVSEK